MGLDDLARTVRRRASSVKAQAQRLPARRSPLPEVCEDVKGWAAARGVESTLLFPARRLVREPPKTVEAEIQAGYTERLVADQRERYLVPIAHARLLGANGLVVLPDGSYSSESIYTSALLEQEPHYRRPPRLAAVRMPGAYFSLVVNWSANGNYYHWLHDTLLRLYGVLDLLPDGVRFIVPAGLRAFQQDSLRALGIDEQRQVPFDGREVWELETLYFAPPTTSSGSDRDAADAWLRDGMWRAYGITAAADRRLYVSRKLAKQRRVVDEDDVEALLARHGFESVDTEALSFREQVELFARASAVVAPHGAGLANMLFAPAGLTVVDMIQPSKLDWCYVFWTMAGELSHHYWYLVTEERAVPGGEPDTRVPMEKLAATLEQLGLG